MADEAGRLLGGLRPGRYTEDTADVGVDTTGDRVVPTTLGRPHQLATPLEPDS